MNFDEALDATGMLCPLPVLKAAKRLRELPSNGVLKVIADDPAAVIDFPHFCTEKGYDLLKSSQNNGVQTYFIRKPRA